MRNLYARLNVSPAASVEEIRSAIAACANASVRSDATQVLLFEDRRRSYDRIHKVLLEIGQLRAALGLSHGDNWRGDAATDYTRPAVPSRSRYAEFKAKFDGLAARQSERRAEMERRARAERVRQTVGSGAGRAGTAIAGLVAGLWGLFVGLVKVAAVLAAVGVAIYIFGALMDQGERAGTATRPVAAAVPSAPAFSAPPVVQPPSGTLRRFSPGEAIAPFQIQTSGAGSYLVKLEDAYRGTDVMDIFVRGGDTIEVEVPLGTYVVKYASGTTWYGYDYRFGPETSYNKAETTFAFRNDGYQITGYTVTLYQVRDGNMQTRRLSPAEF
jgi:hypothetical protein